MHTLGEIIHAEKLRNRTVVGERNEWKGDKQSVFSSIHSQRVVCLGCRGADHRGTQTKHWWRSLKL